jgi:uncharacterized membrane protein YeaQ/YmgE (transglycosylase-associated protein family)
MRARAWSRFDLDQIRESSLIPVPDLAKILTWLIVGLLGGSAAAGVVKRTHKGYGLAVNIPLGSLGARVGGIVFRIFKILPALDSISVSIRDLLSARFGSLLVLAASWTLQWPHAYSGSAVLDRCR